MFRKDRDRHGGGVMLIVRDSITTARRHDLEAECVLLWVELTSSPLNVLFIVFYALMASKTMPYSSCKILYAVLKVANPCYRVSMVDTTMVE